MHRVLHPHLEKHAVSPAGQGQELRVNGLPLPSSVNTVCPPPSRGLTETLGVGSSEGQLNVLA